MASRRPQAHGARQAAELESGVVIAAHGRHYLVQAGDQKLQCVTRGKKTDVSVGDRIRFARTSPNQGVVESIDERRTLLYRSDQYKSKLLAANVTQLFIVVATEPTFADDLVSRSLVAAESAGVDAHLILNKTDITEALPRTRERLQVYARLGYPVHEVSATARPEDTRALFMPLLTGQSTILIGQSGMGKSSIINLIIPDADIAVREISAALDTGKHTTTFTRLYQMDEGASIIDSPGFQEFGLYQLSEGMLERAFRDFRPHLGHCRFYNCHHLTEPDCAVLAAVKTGEIAPMRHQLYAQLVHESSQTLY
ncbi:ribosome small subunit-dependent GTPase A [Herbaspirillum sp. alder98]|uniref:ribosome small subunit-dependent GTPase A n=1 Tax=Herbaspirillum sp. alder98 TaxID=2913096 RepID=UPI001CD859DC|nr:ribosome small subunit-dependent GTPase A [Herbaspirillum sp. alder98]MCA1323270.1 ribosome small subunit-dependent GTPase A [Herbaspirillum sp. alder98]